ncbi:MAG TPA: hypothetical protein VJ955_02910, partial [Desulfuromonadales bacterium]|nr:hypothetical protein [Desulfuromonadales bacterium]
IAGFADKGKEQKPAELLTFYRPFSIVKSLLVCLKRFILITTAAKGIESCQSALSAYSTQGSAA